MRQKKGKKGLTERADYGVSSAKVTCVIWTVEGGVKCADVGLALKAVSMMVLIMSVRFFVNQGGTADKVYSSLTENFCQGLFYVLEEFKMLLLTKRW